MKTFALGSSFSNPFASSTAFRTESLSFSYFTIDTTDVIPILKDDYIVDLKKIATI